MPATEGATSLAPVNSREARLDDRRRRLLRFFNRPATQLTIGVLILISVMLTLVELSLEESARTLLTIERINYGITLVFAVELSLRFVAESGREHPVRSYLKRWWIDLLAVVPFLIPPMASFRLFRGVRVFRYMRLLRLARLFSASRNFLPYVVRKGSIHFVIVMFTLFASITVGTALILSFERVSNPEINGLADAFWFSLYSLFAGEPIPGVPATTSGRVASVAVMFMGLLVFAALVGTISAFMIERLQKEGRMGNSERYEDHVILCGLGALGYSVLDVLLGLDQRVVAIEGDEGSELVDKARARKVPVIAEDVRKAGVLSKAGVEKARAVIACTGDDMVNLEIALDARHERPDVRVVLRMFDQRLAQKVAEGFNIQIAFSSSVLAAPAFAAAAIDRSVLGSFKVRDRIYIQSEFEVPADSPLVGMTISELRDEFEVHTLVYQAADSAEHWAPRFDERVPADAAIVVTGPFDKVAALKEVCGVTQDLVRAFDRDSVATPV